MTTTEFSKILKDLTDEELMAFGDSIFNEKRDRSERKRVRLIENFRKAYFEIKDAGIEISVDDNCYHDDDGYWVETFDNFNFY